MVKHEHTNLQEYLLVAQFEAGALPHGSFDGFGHGLLVVWRSNALEWIL